MSKMTDEQIKKALEVCSMTNMTLECKNCPYNTFNVRYCSIKLCEDALDLINRQQKTIEILRSCVEQHHIMRKDGKSPLSLLTEEIKAETIKEFADRLKEDIRKSWYYNLCEAKDEEKAFKEIDNLVKEMVGETDV